MIAAFGIGAGGVSGCASAPGHWTPPPISPVGSARFDDVQMRSAGSVQFTKRWTDASAHGASKSGVSSLGSRVDPMDRTPQWPAGDTLDGNARPEAGVNLTAAVGADAGEATRQLTAKLRDKESVEPTGATTLTRSASKGDHLSALKIGQAIDEAGYVETTTAVAQTPLGPSAGMRTSTDRKAAEGLTDAPPSPAVVSPKEPSDLVLATQGARDARKATQMSNRLATAAIDYALGAGDEVRVSVFGQPDMGGIFQVGAHGGVAMPLIGDIAASHLTVSEFTARLKDRLRADGMVQKPYVTVEVTRYRPFYILGEVNNPGSYPFVPGMTVFKAVATAGGFTYRANRKKAGITNGEGGDEYLIDISATRPVAPGDTVRIPEKLF